MRAILRRLRGDARGATIIEFAIIAPVMILLIMGLCDLAYQGYMQSVLTGAMQKAGRDNTIQGDQSASAESVIDQKVLSTMRTVNSKAAFASTPTRKSYAQFGYIAPEPFVDTNNNGVYDAASECFTDLNGNGTWDADPGITGNGGANDAVVYTVSINYPRLFPMWGLMGWPQIATLTATTILKNQPYALQNSYAATQVCPS